MVHLGAETVGARLHVFACGRDVKETLELHGDGGGKVHFQFDRVFGPAAR